MRGLLQISSGVPTAIMKFVYEDYMSRNVAVHQIGSWNKATGLQMDRAHAHCCYNLTGYEITIVYTPVRHTF